MDKNENRQSKRLSDKFLHTIFPNPFSDIQARTFSDKRVYSEFVPTSIFWTLFNNQHEVIVGTRGSGKTVLMRMMRYSLLKKIDDEKAKKLVREKNFFALYAPMHNEFIEKISAPYLTEDQKDEWFCFGFNCLLIDSLIVELSAYLSDFENYYRLTKEFEITYMLSTMWNVNANLRKMDLVELRSVIRKLFYNTNSSAPIPDTVPAILKQSLCSPLAAVNIEISELLTFSEQPTWIVCIDDAEVLKQNHMVCINTLMRSESNHIAIKIADLPYAHDMSSPKGQKIHATVGNDYKLTFLDISEKEFENLTNTLCKSRLSANYSDLSVASLTLEEFVGVEGKDDYLDYYKKEFPKDSSETKIREGILMSVSDERKKTAKNTENQSILRQSIYKKLAPIYYIREMYLDLQQGNTKPGWYAGAKMIRKISNRNPRMFLRIMDALFSKAQITELTPKAQSEELLRFSKRVCDETQSLEAYGPEISTKLQKIAEELKNRTHNGELKESGTTFRFAASNFDNQRQWIEIAIANSRLFADEKSMISGLTYESEFDISYIYATYFWIPMRRNSNCPIITIFGSDTIKDYSYTIKKPEIKSKNDYPSQLTLFDITEDDNNENN